MSEENKIHILYERFDNNVSQIVVYAKAASIDAHINCMHLESFAIGILTAGPNEVNSLLVDLDVDLNACLRLIKKEFIGKAEVGAVVPDFSGKMPVSKEVLEMCVVADEISTDMDVEFIGLIHIFLALLQESKLIKNIFAKQGLDVGHMVTVLREMESTRNHPDHPEHPDHDQSASDRKKIGRAHV